MAWNLLKLVPMTPNKLSAYAHQVLDTHHALLHRELPRLSQAFATAPETLRRPWDQLARTMEMHLMKEEEILFPYIRALAAAAEQGTPPPPNMFGTVMNPIRMMEAEHQSAGNELEIVRALTHNFTVPADGCATYRVCFEELSAFDRDLRLHIHLENNILFPKALELESALVGAPVARRGR